MFSSALNYFKIKIDQIKMRFYTDEQLLDALDIIEAYNDYTDIKYEEIATARIIIAKELLRRNIIFW